MTLFFFVFFFIVFLFFFAFFVYYYFSLYSDTFIYTSYKTWAIYLLIIIIQSELKLDSCYVHDDMHNKHLN